MTDLLIDNSYGGEVFCERLVRIDRLGLNRRLIFATTDVTDPKCSVVAAKLVIPADFMVTLAYMAAGADPAQVSRELIALVPSTVN